MATVCLVQCRNMKAYKNILAKISLQYETRTVWYFTFSRAATQIETFDGHAFPIETLRQLRKSLEIVASKLDYF